MTMLIADWNPLGKNVFYRKTELYSMGWGDQVNLSDFTVASANYGGPLALVRDEKKLVKVQSSGRPIIYIYSASGQPLSTIKWKSGRLIHIAWSSSEDLLCVTDDGIIHVYDIFGTLQDHFNLGQEAKDTKILDFKVFYTYAHGTGVAVITGSYRFFLVNNIKEPKVRKLAEIPGLDTPPSSWTVVSEGKETRLLVAKDAQLFQLDQVEMQIQQLRPEFNSRVNAITEMAVSPNGEYLALYSDGGAIWMGTSNLKEKTSEFDTKCPERPQSLVWCGNSAVVGCWQNLLLIVGPEKDYLNYNFDSAIHLVAEIDGIRIITNSSHELLQKVPGVVMDIFRIGSVAPGALLLEASKEFQRRSHKADDYVRMIREKNNLELAVMQCIQAAGHEWSPATQKMLLRAASFGKCFIPNVDPTPLVNMCLILRVLNNVRHHFVGLPLTQTQLDYLTLPVLLDRLVLRRHYPLAIRICKSMKIPDTEGASRILAHWACYKMKQPQWDGESAANEIAEKLGDTPGISYSEIANKAVENGKIQLAIRLLDYEPRASEQVPLLIKLKQEEQAMLKAIDSGDTDLVDMVILYLQKTLPQGDFHMTIRKFPLGYALYLKLCKQLSLDQLRNMYYKEDDFCSQGDCRVMESFATNKMEKRISVLQLAAEDYRKGKSDFNAQQTEEQLKLMKYQLKLTEKLNYPYVDLSLQQTMRQLIHDKKFKEAENMHKEFKVPDRRYWWMKISALAETNEWLELDKFSRSKKSPIGYEPFIDVCLKYNNKYEAQKYLTKVKDENKVKYYTNVGLLEEAAKIAHEQKDEAALNSIQSKCGILNRALFEKINVMKADLNRR